MVNILFKPRTHGAETAPGTAAFYQQSNRGVLSKVNTQGLPHHARCGSPVSYIRLLVKQVHHHIKYAGVFNDGLLFVQEVGRQVHGKAVPVNTDIGGGMLRRGVLIGEGITGSAGIRIFIFTLCANGQATGFVVGRNNDSGVITIADPIQNYLYGVIQGVCVVSYYTPTRRS